MNPESENFDALRRLLALKRHEMPPPGYFDRFSRDVMARIKAGETGDEMAFDSSWLERLLGIFDVKPVFAGAFGAAVCALLVSGVISSEQNAGTRSGSETAALSSPLPLPVVAANVPDANSYRISNTNPAVTAFGNGSLFDQLQPNIEVQQASFLVPHQN